MGKRSVISHCEEDVTGSNEYDSQILRILDFRLLPLLSIIYFVAYLDRSNLSNVEKEISEALVMTTSQYALASSMFKVGYILFDIPANMIISKIRASLWIGTLGVLFGFVAASTSLVTSFEHLVAARVILGIAEAGVTPGCLYYLGLWYKPTELAQRNSIFFVSSAIANAASGVIAFYVLQMDGAWNISGWQWLFILEGCPALLMGLFTMVRTQKIPHFSFPSISLTHCSMLVLNRMTMRRDVAALFLHHRVFLPSSPPASNLPCFSREGLLARFAGHVSLVQPGAEAGSCERDRERARSAQGTRSVV